VEKEGYFSHEDTITVESGETVDVIFELHPRTGFVNIMSTPDSSRVSIDDSDLGFTPIINLEFPVGSRVVELEKIGYKRWQGPLEIKSGLSVTLDATLSVQTKSRSEALARSMIFPGWGQRYRGADRLGKIFSMAAVGGLGACFYTVSRYNSKMDEYEDYNNSGNPEKDKLDKLYDEADKATKLGNVVILATGVIWAVNIAEAVLGFPTNEAGLVRIEPMESDVGLRALVSIQLPWGAS